MEIVRRVTGDGEIPALVWQFTIKPRLNLEPKIIEDREGQTSIGLFVDIETGWQVRASIGDLAPRASTCGGLPSFVAHQFQDKRPSTVPSGRSLANKSSLRSLSTKTGASLRGRLG